MYTLFLILLTALQYAASVSAQCPSLTANYPAPSVAPGYSAILIAQGLTKPRGLIFDKKGNLLVVEKGKGISVHQVVQHSNGNCFSFKTLATIVPDTTLNHGIALSPDGKKLYTSNPNSVYEFPYSPEKASNTSTAKTLITNMQSPGFKGDRMITRSLLIPQTSPNKLIVSRGAGDNIDLYATSLDSGRSQIRIFDLSSENKDAISYTDGKVLAWGIRNAVALAENPQDGGIWSTDANVDILHSNGLINEDNPAEELNYHGSITDDNAAERGRNFGFPHCVPVWDGHEFPDLHVGEQYVVSGDNSSWNAEFCRDGVAGPRLVFAPHTTPLGVLFDGRGENAFVAFHGSHVPKDDGDDVRWSVAVVGFGRNGQPIEAPTSRRAAVPIVRNKDTRGCPGSCFRPVGLAWDGEGRLFFTSDVTGEIYVVLKNGKGMNEAGERIDEKKENVGMPMRVQFGLPAAVVTLAGCVLSYIL